MREANNPRIAIMAILFFSALAVHSLFATFIDSHGSADATYYHLMAGRLIDGKGFTEPFIWNHLKSYESFEHPVDYWQPLGIVFYALTQKCGWMGSEVVGNHLIWSFLAVCVFTLVFRATQEIPEKARHPGVFRVFTPSVDDMIPAIIAFVMFIVGGNYGYHVSTTDNIAIYGGLGYLLLQISARPDLNFILALTAGIITGLMGLTRIDGAVFFILTAGLIWKSTKKVTLMIVVGAGFFLIASPWIYRNCTVLGTPWPSNSKAFFLRDYDEMLTPDVPLTLNYYLEMGSATIISRKLESLVKNLKEYLLVPTFWLFLPFLIMGVIDRWKAFGAPLTFFTSFFWLISGVCFTTQSLRGTSFHISAAFFPHFCIACGIGFAIFRKNKSNGLRILLGVSTIAWIFIYSINIFHRIDLEYKESREPYRKLFSSYAFPPDSTWAVSDPMSVYLYSGCGCVITPPAKVFTTAMKYHLDHVIIDSRVIVDGNFPDIPQNWETVVSMPPLFVYALSSQSKNLFSR